MQIAINDELVQQTMQAFNTQNKQLALENAIRFFLQAHAKNQNNIKPKKSLASALEELRNICTEENYQLTPPPRFNRQNPFADD